MKLRHFALIFFLISSLALNAQSNKKYKLIGGMYLHSGYLDNINNLSYGLGGKLTFGLNNYFRIGTEGYGSNSNFKKDGSFYSIGWGGILGEFIFYNTNKTNLMAGLTIGGGTNKQMNIDKLSDKVGMPDFVFWQEASTVIISPFISLEYSISEKANISMKFDYLISPNNKIFNSGLRIYIGCLFNMN